MTYTYKLARRLAISRKLAMPLQVLVLCAACAGESMAPDSQFPETNPTTPSDPADFHVVPKAVTAEINQKVQFRAEVRTAAGLAHAPTSWAVMGAGPDSDKFGTIDDSGTFVATAPGTYLVVGRGSRRIGHRGQVSGRYGEDRWSDRIATMDLPDTSVVVVVRRPPALKNIRVRPREATLEVRDTLTFNAVGRLGSGGTVPVGATWTATGGTIDAGGFYQAGDLPGQYLVIATHTGGTLADTVAVQITASATPPDTSANSPEPPPQDTVPTAPEPELARVVLKPASVVLAVQTTHQFAVFGRSTAGDSMAVDVTFTATGGTITPTGLYSAGSTAGTYRVIAKASDLADTAVVTLAQTSGGDTPEPAPTPGIGLPFGPTGLLDGTQDVAPFTMGNQAASPSSIVTLIRDARARGARVMLNMTGGSHTNYLTNGVFDRAKWNARMDAYNTSTIRQAVAAAVADGVIVGNSVMDEPHVSGGGDGNTWGPPGTMTKAIVDDMCGYVKRIFPTLPVGVAHRHDKFEPTKSYRVCEFIISQYSSRIGSVTTFRDAGLALARRDGHAIMFSMNILNGGTQDTDGTWDCAGTGGKGTFAPSCRMTPQQIRDFGRALGPAGCGLAMWRYDASFISYTENLRAFRDVAALLATQPGKACRRS
jgi:hypothetical protein